eukprot:CAMPEP_0196789084 /NCGR_PEP_ID=MMETSP1104-20130614/26004_1 /TAXON_ID=33652 /ORGANISM="Cafeteria sp., Strain Caron Lab Isolate" /LENGTH=86 /DNA_ID=CAMNT_0042159435 /DNA_START=163 /DNA_END=421 /DNA_ORIENTATION=-
MSADAALPPVVAVASLQHRHNAAVAADVGHLHQLARGPQIVLRQQVHAAPVVTVVARVANVVPASIEASADHEHVRVEGTQRGKHA